MTLDGYTLKDWKIFCSDLEKLYPNMVASNRYTGAGLQEFIRISAQMCIQDEDNLMLYYRCFLQISSPLQLSDEEWNAKFINGFHPRGRDVIYK